MAGLVDAGALRLPTTSRCTSARDHFCLVCLGASSYEHDTLLEIRQWVTVPPDRRNHHNWLVEYVISHSHLESMNHAGILLSNSTGRHVVDMRCHAEDARFVRFMRGERNTVPERGRSMRFHINSKILMNAYFYRWIGII